MVEESRISKNVRNPPGCICVLCAPPAIATSPVDAMDTKHIFPFVFRPLLGLVRERTQHPGDVVATRARALARAAAPGLCRGAMLLLAATAVAPRADAGIYIVNWVLKRVDYIEEYDSCADLEADIGPLGGHMSCVPCQSGGVYIVYDDPLTSEMLIHSLVTGALLDTQYSGVGEYDFGAFAGTPIRFTYRDIATKFVTSTLEMPTGSPVGLAAESVDHVGVSYCSVASNSTGGHGSLSALGFEQAVRNNLALRAEDLPAHSTGLFLASMTQGFTMNPGSSAGNLCVGGAVGRYSGPGQVMNSGPTGVLSLVLDLSMTPTPTGTVSVSAGDTWNFQVWYRDSMAGVHTSNFTAGLEVQFK